MRRSLHRVPTLSKMPAASPFHSTSRARWSAGAISLSELSRGTYDELTKRRVFTRLSASRTPAPEEVPMHRMVVALSILAGLAYSGVTPVWSQGGHHVMVSPADLKRADVPSLPPGAKIAVI
jgi:hypothetical protein